MTITDTDSQDVLLKIFQDYCAKATNQNRSFGASAKEVFMLLYNYKKDEPIPERFWDVYQELTTSVGYDNTGRLIFTDIQEICMNFIYAMLGVKGLLVHLPDENELKEKLTRVASKYSDKSFLLENFIPSLLDNAGQNIEIYLFIILLQRGTGSVIQKLKTIRPVTAQALALVDLATFSFPVQLVDTFIENPQLADYAKKFLHKIYESRTVEL